MSPCGRSGRSTLMLLVIGLILHHQWIISSTIVCAMAQNNNSPVDENEAATTSPSLSSQQEDTNFLDGEDEATLLDVFGDAARDFLTHRLIPDTDEECKWNWKHARCEPFCECDFRPELGDYHIGRSCRYRDAIEDKNGGAATNTVSLKSLLFNQNEEGVENENDDSTASSERQTNHDWIGRETCHLPPDTPYVKLIGGLLNGAKRAGKRLKVGAKGIVQKTDVKGRLGRARHEVCASLSDSMQQQNTVKDGADYSSDDGNSDRTLDKQKRRMQRLLHCSGDERELSEILNETNMEDEYE